MTVLDIINRALRLLGVAATGETADSPEADDAFWVLNTMIDQWNNEKLMTFSIRNDVFPIFGSQASYTIGKPYSIGPTTYTPDWITDRPNPSGIQHAFVRDNSPGYLNDFKLEIIPNNKYQDLYQKTLQTTYPMYLWYLPDLPWGTVTLWPVPMRNMQCGISTWEQITRFTGLTQEIALPQGYEMALAYGLAYHIAMEYGKDPTPFKILMEEAKGNVRGVNDEKVLLKTDPALYPNPPRSFNIFGGLSL